MLTNMHDFHFSTIELNINTSRNSIEITSHIFIDDLELEIFDGQKIDILDSLDNKSLFNNYFNKHLSVINKSSILELNYLGSEPTQSLDALWIYLEIENINPRIMEISVDILMAMYEDQRNLVTIKKDNQKIISKLLDRNDYTFEYHSP